MHKTLIAVIAAALLLPAAVPAQSAAQRPDPLDAEAPSAPLVYRSALSGYKTLAAESPVVAWRDANDAVLRIGGWRAYAREAAAPAASSPAAAASAPAPEPRSSRPATPPSCHRH
jgi:hypothetical protein